MGNTRSHEMIGGRFATFRPYCLRQEINYLWSWVIYSHLAALQIGVETRPRQCFEVYPLKLSVSRKRV